MLHHAEFWFLFGFSVECVHPFSADGAHMIRYTPNLPNPCNLWKLWETKTSRACIHRGFAFLPSAFSPSTFSYFQPPHFQWVTLEWIYPGEIWTSLGGHTCPPRLVHSSPWWLKAESRSAKLRCIRARGFCLPQILQITQILQIGQIGLKACHFTDYTDWADGMSYPSIKPKK